MQSSSTTRVQQLRVRILSLPLSLHVSSIVVGNCWLRSFRESTLYTLEGEFLYQWQNVYNIILPSCVEEYDGYLLIVHDHDPNDSENTKGWLYAYNSIAKVVDWIASSVSSPPSNDCMLSNALASWSLMMR
jgi:hypothetical protein